MTLTSALLIIASVFGIFVITIIFTRIFGLRTFAKISSIDFASTIAIGSVLASVILNENQSLIKGALALGCIIGFQTLFSIIIRKNKFLQNILTNQPQLLMKDGEFIYENLKKCNVGMDDLRAKLREANVHNIQHVQAIVFESTGDISILHSAENLEVDSTILEDVNKVN